MPAGAGPFLLAGVNLIIVVLLAADKWVHRVTGKAPLESRVETLEKQLEDGNSRLSEKFSAIQSKFGQIDIGLTEMRTELRLRRGFTIDKYSGDGV
jgi:hypothetical protein